MKRKYVISNYIGRIFGTQHEYLDIETGKIVVDGFYRSVNDYLRVEIHEDVENKKIETNAMPSGFRAYPHVEFKKEAFVLFEGLLKKIKNDLIKFLLNLNIVVSNEENSENVRKELKEYKSDKKVGRNEKCPCGSGKKFKHCHGSL